MMELEPLTEMCNIIKHQYNCVIIPDILYNAILCSYMATNKCLYRFPEIQVGMGSVSVHGPVTSITS